MRNVWAITFRYAVSIFMFTFIFSALAEGYRYEISDGAITITGYDGAAGVLHIPDSIDGLPVVRIGRAAFLSRSGLTSVAIPDSVTRIDDFAFAGCQALTNVSLSANLAHIGMQAFSTCWKLPYLALPASLTNIGERAFYRCQKATAIDVDFFNPVYASDNGVLFHRNNRTLIVYPGGRAGAYVIPDGTTTIADQAFFFSEQVTNVSIPSSVTNIGANAFGYCSKLSSITVPETSDTYFSQDGVLFSRSPMVLVAYPAGRGGHYAVPDSVIRIGDAAFYGARGLTSVVLGNNVTHIGASAFGDCVRLASIAIPEGVTEIGSDAFSYCYSLIDVALPVSVTQIGASAFYWCTHLSTVSLSSNLTSLPDWLFAGCFALTSVRIPAQVSSIGRWAFYSCHNLRRIECEGDAPVMGASVFDGANDVTVYYIPGTAGWGTSLAGRPTVRLIPEIVEIALQSSSQPFGFVVAWESNRVVVVEASSDLLTWSPLTTNTLSAAAWSFEDPDSIGVTRRMYRVSAQ